MLRVFEPDLVSLRKFVAPEFIFGVGAMGLFDRFLANLGVRRPLLVSDPGVHAAGWTQVVAEGIKKQGLSYTLFEGVTPNPKDHEVAAGVECFRANRCDGIVVVGGGSAIDCAKGIGILASNGGEIGDYEGVDTIASPIPPLLCIPTTAGSSADVSQFAIITHTSQRRKFAIVSKAVVPDVSLIDPQTTLTMDHDLTAATGVDALSHALESLASNASSSITDVHALRAIELIAGTLPALIERPDDLELRTRQMAASLHAGLSFSNASLGIVHAMAHAMGGLYGMAHGFCNSALLNTCVRFNFPSAAGKYRKALAALNVPVSGDDAADCATLTERLGKLVPERWDHNSLAGPVFDAATVQALAERAAADVCLLTNPRQASVAEIAGLYREVLP
jgi:alcohol dehydrogenase class IV